MTIAVKTKSTTDNLCDYCQHSFATCNQSFIEFGNGVGNDNVIICSEFTQKRYHNSYPVEAVTDREGKVIHGFLRSNNKKLWY